MIPIVAVIGSKKSGKTGVVTGLLRCFSEKGLRVGVLKNSHHDITIDTPGTDTWKFKEAGARRVLLSWPGGAAMTHIERSGEPDPVSLAEPFMDGLDMVLAEGYKHFPIPKVLVCTRGDVVDFNPEGLLATVGGNGGPWGVPEFPREEIGKLATFLVERLLLQRRESMRISVRVNGEEVWLKEFVREFLSGAIVGMISTLKGCENPEKIEITVDLEGGESSGKEEKSR